MLVTVREISSRWNQSFICLPMDDALWSLLNAYLWSGHMLSYEILLVDGVDLVRWFAPPHAYRVSATGGLSLAHE